MAGVVVAGDGDEPWCVRPFSPSGARTDDFAAKIRRYDRYAFSGARSRLQLTPARSQPRRTPLHALLRSPSPHPPSAQLPRTPRQERHQRQQHHPRFLHQARRPRHHSHGDRAARNGERRRQLRQRGHTGHRMSAGHLPPNPLRSVPPLLSPSPLTLGSQECSSQNPSSSPPPPLSSRTSSRPTLPP